MRSRCPEQGHHRVADELLDRAAEALELRADTCVVGREQRPYLLGVEPLCLCSEADEVGEQYRHYLALFARRRSLLG